MGRFTLRMPKTLHNELEVLAKDEGVSLNQYIIYTLTQKVTAEKLDPLADSYQRGQDETFGQIKPFTPEQVAGQRSAFEALLARLGKEATPAEVRRYLAQREPTSPEPDLNPQAAERLQARIAQANQAAR